MFKILAVFCQFFKAKKVPICFLKRSPFEEFSTLNQLFPTVSRLLLCEDHPASVHVRQVHRSVRVARAEEGTRAALQGLLRPRPQAGHHLTLAPCEAGFGGFGISSRLYIALATEQTGVFFVLV